MLNGESVPEEETKAESPRGGRGLASLCHSSTLQATTGSAEGFYPQARLMLWSCGFTLAYFEEPACVWEDGEKDRRVQCVRDVAVWNRATQGRREGSVVVLRKWMAFRVTQVLGKPFTSEPHPQLRRQSEGLRR